MKTEYTKKVVIEKNGSEIEVHLSRGQFYKYDGERRYTVDGEFGRCGGRCGNDWHGEYGEMKAAFLRFIGEKVLDGYVVKSVEVC